MSVLGAPFPPLSEGLVFVLQQSPLWLPVSLRKVGNRSSLLQHTPISKNPFRRQPSNRRKLLRQDAARQRRAMCFGRTYRSSGAETSPWMAAIDILLLWSKDVRFRCSVSSLIRRVGFCATTEPPVAARIASESRESEFPPTTHAHL